MKNNLGTIDRAIRVLLALLIVVLYFTHVITGTIAVILLIVAGISLVTGILGFCPAYKLIGLSSGKKE